MCPEPFSIDLKEDLSRNPEEHGGRHPLQDPDLLAAKLGKIGIDRQTDVVVYDDSGGMFAARFWWQLHYLGHDSVYIMDGGLSNWIKAGYEVNAERILVLASANLSRRSEKTNCSMPKKY